MNTKEYNAIASKLEADAGRGNIPKEDRRLMVEDIVSMERAAADAGKAFRRNGQAGEYSLLEVGRTKAEAQREYLRSFDNQKRVGPAGETLRQMNAKRFKVGCPA